MSALALARTDLPQSARELLRVSADDSKRMVSTEQQHRANAREAELLDVALLAPYINTGPDGRPQAISASRYGKRIRTEWAALMSDLDAGTFGADMLIVWSVSRGSRKSEEWSALMNAMLAAGVYWLRVTEDAMTYDVRNGRHRKIVRDSASAAEYESDDKSDAVKRAMLAEAEAGNPHGRKTYGYDREYQLADPGADLPAGWYRLASDGNKIARQVPAEAIPLDGSACSEAEAVRVVYAALLAGESARSIAAALSGEGPRPAMGDLLGSFAERLRGTGGAPGSWPATRVRDIALNPAYAGKRLHGTDSNLAGARQAYSLADLKDGNWPALVPFADWCTVAERLRGNKPTATTKGRQPKHLLSLIATCGVCGGPLAVRFKHRAQRPTYLCQRGGHVSCDRDSLDLLVTSAVQRALSDPEHYPALMPADSPELLQAREAEASVRASLADYEAHASTMPAASFARIAADLTAQIETAAARVRRLQSPGKLSSLGLQPGADIAARWHAAPLTARRDAIRQLFASIVLQPAGRHYSGTVTDRTDLTWRTR